MIVEAALSLETNTVPVATMDGSVFSNLVKHVRPRLIYLVVVAFDAGEDTEVALEVQDEEESILSSPPVKKFVAKWRHRDGQTCRVALGLMCDGVLHGNIQDADWHAEFEEAAEALEAELAGAREEATQRVAAEGKKQLAPKIKQLMADPRFSASKVGVAKRTVLAEALFPDLDRDTIRAIVERAENDHWLAMASR